MATKQKMKATGPEDDEKPDEEEETGDDKGTEDSGGDDAGGGDLEAHIKRVVESVVDGLFGDRDKDVKTSPAQDEHAIRRMVKDAQADLKKEEEKDSRFDSVAETVESLKKAVERAPARDGIGGKLQRLMWGSDD